jgi:ABC-type nickel/cobalt efflux system permease component RcnA
MSVAFRFFVSIACAILATLALWRFLPNTAQSQTAAAWFQAIGSIAAIVAAFWMGERQARAALQSVVDAHSIEQKDRRRSILAVAEAAAEHARRIDEAFSQPEPRPALTSVYDKTIIAGMAEALGRAPAHEVGSRDGVIALLC